MRKEQRKCIVSALSGTLGHIHVISTLTGWPSFSSQRDSFKGF